jgi:pyruvate ferredoxin oxidoreductase alpha subunit
VVVALGSVLGTLKETVDEMREQGVKIGVLGISCFRPFPLAAVRAALQGAKRVVVLEKSFSVGLGGVVSTDVRLALSRLCRRRATRWWPGSAGGPSRRPRCGACCSRPRPGSCRALTFLDLDWRIVNRQLAREREQRSGPDRREPAARRRHRGLETG